MVSRILVAGALLLGACTCSDVQPRLDLRTEEISEDAFLVQLSSSNCFSGTATLTASLSDPGGAIALDTTYLTVPYNGTASTIARVTIPENAARPITARITASTGTSAVVLAETTIN